MADRYIAKGTTTISTILSGDSGIFGEGEQTVSGGTDLSGKTTLVDILVKRAFTGHIVDLQFDNSGVCWYDAGGGSMSIIANGTATEVIAKVLFTGAGVLTAKTAGTITLWDQTSMGPGYIMDSINVTTIALGGGSLDQMYKSTANTTWHIMGGNFRTGRGVTTGNIYGGNIVVRREDSSATVPTATTLNLYGPAKVKWQGGNITTLNFYHPDALFDASEAPAALTVGVVNGHAKAFRRSGLPIVAGGTVINTTNRNITLSSIGTIYGGKAENYAQWGGGPQV